MPHENRKDELPSAVEPIVSLDGLLPDLEDEETRLGKEAIPAEEEPRFKARVASRGEHPTSPFGLGRPGLDLGQRLISRSSGAAAAGGPRFTAGPTTIALRQVAGIKDPVEAGLIKNTLRAQMLGGREGSRLPMKDRIRGTERILDDRAQLLRYREERRQTEEETRQKMWTQLLKVGSDAGKRTNPQTGEEFGFLEGLKQAFDHVPGLRERFEQAKGLTRGDHPDLLKKISEDLSFVGAEDPDERFRRQRAAAADRQARERERGIQERFRQTERTRLREKGELKGEVQKKELANLDRDIMARTEDITKARMGRHPGMNPVHAWREAILERRKDLERLGVDFEDYGSAEKTPWKKLGQMRMRLQPSREALPEKAKRREKQIDRAAMVSSLAKAEAELSPETLSIAMAQGRSLALDYEQKGLFRTKDAAEMREGLGDIVAQTPDPNIRIPVLATFDDPVQITFDLRRAITFRKLQPQVAVMIRQELLRRQQIAEKHSEGLAIQFAQPIGLIDRYTGPPQEGGLTNQAAAGKAMWNP